MWCRALDRRSILLAVIAGAVVLGGCAEPQEPARPRSVLLLVIDTLRADHLGTYGGLRPASPVLDRFAAEGTQFDRAWATSPWTLPSFGSLFSGQPPSLHSAGTLLKRGDQPVVAVLDPQVPVLAELMQDAGFATGAIINNPFLKERFGIARGFDHWEHVFRDYTAHPRADLLVSAALAWLDTLEGMPFLLVINFFDPHLPYDAGPGARGSFTGTYKGRLRLPFAGLGKNNRRWKPPVKDQDFVSAAYDEEILYADGQIERLLEALEERGIGDETLAVVAADHGEEFFDHGSFEHGHTMYEELLRVPLLVRGPGVTRQRVTAPVSLVDVMPTILDAVGLEPPPGLVGESLWPILTGRGDGPKVDRALFSEAPLYPPDRSAMIRWPWKLILTSGGEPALYELQADPGERANRAAVERERLAAMRKELRALRRRAAPGRRPVVLDDETRRQLEGLGYLEPGGETEPAP